MKAITCVATLFLGGLTACQDREEKANVSPEIVATIDRIQKESGVSDEDLTKSLERWVEMYAGAKELLESDDIFGNGAWTPERYAELMVETERMLKETIKEDQTLAIYSLGYLRLINDKQPDEAADLMRSTLAKYYRSIRENPKDVEVTFLKNLRKLADEDPDLKKLLEESE